MREVGAFEAKNKLGQLLDLVEAERGSHHAPWPVVARLVPPRPAAEQAREAASAIRAMEQGASRSAG